jgi:hypothetical protein
MLAVALKMAEGHTPKWKVDELNKLLDVPGVLLLRAGAFLGQPSFEENAVRRDGARRVVRGIVRKVLETVVHLKVGRGRRPGRVRVGPGRRTGIGVHESGEKRERTTAMTTDGAERMSTYRLSDRNEN